MKRLSDKELAAIGHAASYLTNIQTNNTEVIYMAYYLWEIYNRHLTEERHKKVFEIEQYLFNL